MGIPVTAVVTGANVHDSQVAIPMEKLTERKTHHLYSLMDSAYDARDIRNYIEGKGRVAIIDGNKRRSDGARSFDAAEKERFKIRSTVERANYHLKDWLIGGKVHVRGIRMISLHMMSGVVCLAAGKILQYLVVPRQDADAAWLPDPIVKDGFIEVWDRPGMGIGLNEKAAKKYLREEDKGFFD